MTTANSMESLTTESYNEHYYDYNEDYYDHRNRLNDYDDSFRSVFDESTDDKTVYHNLKENMKGTTYSYYNNSDISSTDPLSYYSDLYNYYYYEDYYDYNYDKPSEKTVHDNPSEKAVYVNPSENAVYDNDSENAVYDNPRAETISGNTTEFTIYDFETVILGYLSPAAVILTTFVNLFVIYYFLRNTTRAKTTRLLFILIAMSDMLTGTFLLPSSVYVYILQNMALSLEWLKGSLYLSRVWQTMSLWQTVLLGVQKYMNLLRPVWYRRFCTYRKSVVAIVVISITAFVFHTYLLNNNKLDHKMCRWGTDQSCTGSVVYTWCCIVLMHLTPCVILIFTTTKTLRKLKNVQQPYHGTPGKAKDMVTIVTVAFIVIVSLIPELLYCIFTLAAVIKIHCNTPFGNFDGRVFYAAYELVLVISFHCKFWIYFIMMRDFRSLLMRLIKCGTCDSRTSDTVTVKSSSNCTTYVATVDSRIGCRPMPAVTPYTTVDSKLNANIYNVIDDVKIGSKV